MFLLLGHGTKVIQKDMKIGIDISQIAHEGTGVAHYVRALVSELVDKDTHNDYVLFGASLRKRAVFYTFFTSLGGLGGRVRLVVAPIPPTILAILWNRLHWAPIEWFIGPVDVFWSSDWTQPPLREAFGITTIHDVSILKYPRESHQSRSIQLSTFRIIANIVETQTQRLRWVKEECQKIFCDSRSTQDDIISLIGIAKEKTIVIYPGI